MLHCCHAGCNTSSVKRFIYSTSSKHFLISSSLHVMACVQMHMSQSARPTGPSAAGRGQVVAGPLGWAAVAVAAAGLIWLLFSRTLSGWVAGWGKGGRQGGKWVSDRSLGGRMVGARHLLLGVQPSNSLQMLFATTVVSSCDQYLTKVENNTQTIWVKHRESCTNPVAETIFTDACFVHLQY